MSSATIGGDMCSFSLLALDQYQLTTISRFSVSMNCCFVFPKNEFSSSCCLLLLVKARHRTESCAHHAVSTSWIPQMHDLGMLVHLLEVRFQSDYEVHMHFNSPALVGLTVLRLVRNATMPSLRTLVNLLCHGWRVLCNSPRKQ